MITLLLVPIAHRVPPQQNNVPGEGDQLRSPELLVLAAEAAVKNGEFDSAREACHEFFLDGGGARDQFYCRALFVKVPLPSICFQLTAPPTSFLVTDFAQKSPPPKLHYAVRYRTAAFGAPPDGSNCPSRPCGLPPVPCSGWRRIQSGMHVVERP